VSVPIPQLPLFRVTFFYGPEPVEDDQERLMCVFNVKKRSWKGGVQVAVEVSDAQVKRLQQSLEFDAWVASALRDVPQAERQSYEARMRDLLIQELCSVKLSIALDLEIRQENTRLPSDRFIEELDQRAVGEADHLKTRILTELDLVR
jgi:hypothetical protein